jgi:hypothetical protein
MDTELLRVGAALVANGTAPTRLRRPVLLLALLGPPGELTALG